MRGGNARWEKDPHAKPAGLEPPAAHQKRIRSGASGKPGGLDIEEQDVTPRGLGVRCARSEGRLLTRGALVDPGGPCKNGETRRVVVHLTRAVVDAPRPVQMLVLEHTLDDDAGAG